MTGLNVICFYSIINISQDFHNSLLYLIISKIVSYAINHNVIMSSKLLKLILWIFSNSSFVMTPVQIEHQKMNSIVGRGFLTAHVLPMLPFSNFVQPSIPFPVASNLHSTALFVALFLWLIGWFCHIWCVVLPNDITYLHMYVKPWYLSTEAPCCVFYATRHQVYWGQACNLYCDLISHVHLHTC